MNKKPNVLIVDLNHLIYRFGDRYFRDFISLEDATDRILLAIKNIEIFLNIDKTIIVADLKCPSRKEYFNELLGYELEYKEGRTRDPKWDSINNLVRDKLSNLYPYVRAFDYEADDIITAFVEKMGNKMNKYILTVDADILPLIDEDTSVLLYKRNAETPLIEGYSLFNKENFTKQIKLIKDFSKPYVTLNNFLLIKMLIGDKSDNIPKVGKYTPFSLTDFFKWGNIDKNFKWNYFLSIEEVEKELKKILVSPEQQKQALNNFKLMQMNSTLENRRTKFSIKKEMLLQKGDHTINSWEIK